MRSRGCNAAMSISLVILPLVGVGWVNSVSGSTSGVISWARAFAGSGGDDRKSLGSSTIRTIPGDVEQHRGYARDARTGRGKPGRPTRSGGAVQRHRVVALRFPSINQGFGDNFGVLPDFIKNRQSSC